MEEEHGDTIAIESEGEVATDSRLRGFKTHQRPVSPHSKLDVVSFDRRPIGVTVEPLSRNERIPSGDERRSEPWRHPSARDSRCKGFQVLAE